MDRRSLKGDAKVRPSDLKKSRSFTLKINIFLVLNDRYLIFFVNKTRDLQIPINYKNNNLRKLLTLITAPSKTPWFLRFFAFSRITRDKFLCYFLIYHRTWLEQFFPVLFRGVTFNVPLEKPKKDQKILTFRIFIKSKKWEYEPLRKNEWLRRFWQNFWVSTNFPTFFGQKIITQKK